MYNGDTPCDECKKVDLLKENHKAWNAWNDLSAMDRKYTNGSPNPLELSVVRLYCELYDLSFNDFKKVRVIEEVIYPTIQEKARETAKEKLDDLKDKSRHVGSPSGIGAPRGSIKNSGTPR